MEAVNGCRSCELDLKLNRNGLCWYCDPARVRERRLAKQAKVFRYLDARGLEGSQTDLPIDRGECGMERPDRVFQEGDRVVIVEVDEHQHKSYPADCEERRMLMVSQYFDFRPVLWIRFNPDEYQSNDTQAKMINRLDYLAKVVDEARQSSRLDAAVKVTYLYYDDWADAVGHRWICLQPLDETIQVRGVLRKEQPLRVGAPARSRGRREPVEEKEEGSDDQEEGDESDDQEEDAFMCKRCGFKTGSKKKLVRHYDRVNPCPPLLEDIPVETLRKTTRVHNVNKWIDPETSMIYYLCNRCGKSFPEYAAKYRHQKACQWGPPRVFDYPSQFLTSIDMERMKKEIADKAIAEYIESQKQHSMQDIKADIGDLKNKMDDILKLLTDRKKRATYASERYKAAKQAEQKE